MQDLVARFKAVGDLTRLKILKFLTGDELCVGELVEVIGLSQSAVSQHLAKLKAAGLVKERRRGQWSYYTADERAIAQLGGSIADFLARDPAEVPDLEEEYRRFRRLDRASCCVDERARI